MQNYSNKQTIQKAQSVGSWWQNILLKICLNDAMKNLGIDPFQAMCCLRGGKHKNVLKLPRGSILRSLSPSSIMILFPTTDKKLPATNTVLPHTFLIGTSTRTNKIKPFLLAKQKQPLTLISASVLPTQILSHHEKEMGFLTFSFYKATNSRVCGEFPASHQYRPCDRLWEES